MVTHPRRALSGLIFLSLIGISQVSSAQTESEIIAEQKALLTSGPWFCEDRTDEDFSGDYFEYFLEGGNCFGKVQMRSSDLNVNVSFGAGWAISEAGVIHTPRGGWYSFSDGAYSDEFGDAGYSAFIKELSIGLSSEWGNGLRDKIVHLTNQKLVTIDDEGEVAECIKIGTLELRERFGVNFIK